MRCLLYQTLRVVCFFAGLFVYNGAANNHTKIFSINQCR
ncbi:hypothetical protein GXM_02913 [Nostoc sphaeroides CCNUC1]|uniref:Uncharacterized protein n=1 Tax=Nostoc sphaeroides CCNUC1 TaxID=2653204 RepID=A0A5P8VZG1_9NOSO|nr:hypothetical protein GXM_02913 [Nostoc sphaeroides CCNUC1]